jgi:hypothetical protein
MFHPAQEKGKLEWANFVMGRDGMLNVRNGFGTFITGGCLVNLRDFPEIV